MSLIRKNVLAFSENLSFQQNEVSIYVNLKSTVLSTAQFRPCHVNLRNKVDVKACCTMYGKRCYTMLKIEKKKDANNLKVFAEKFLKLQ